MKQTLQNILLLSSIILIPACDTGTDGTIDDVGEPVPAPSNGATGAAVKGVIAGATITVTDATGADIGIASGATTSADGSFELVFTEAAIAAGISGPLTVVVDGTGATSVCDYDDPDTTENDCGEGIAFGDTFVLPDGFVLRGTTLDVPTASSLVVTVNVSPVSELAHTLALAAAADSALTIDDVTTADRQVLGLIQSMTGVDMSGLRIADIPLADITSLDADTDAAPDATFAMLAVSAAIVGDIDAGALTVADVMTRLQEQLSLNEDGNLTATGTNLGRFAGAVANALVGIQAQLEARGNTRDGITQAVDAAAANAVIYLGIGAGTIVIPSIALPDSTDSVDLTRAFVAAISAGSDAVMSTTIAEGDLLMTELTDGTVALTFVVNNNGTLVGEGVFTVGSGESAVETATIDANGLVTFSDGSIQILPTTIFSVVAN